MVGCSRSSIKSALTLFPSNHSSRDSPAGVLTAWLRLLRNTLVSIICLLTGICLMSVHDGFCVGIYQRDIRS
ncbi:hypothetical protein AHX51_27070 [Salmonella enterica subsp. diarizonae]|nr:hypothetical protein [Salmonella enterica subsp. diarizonae]